MRIRKNSNSELFWLMAVRQADLFDATEPQDASEVVAEAICTGRGDREREAQPQLPPEDLSSRIAGERE